ncbi:competence protein ComGB [Peribacillus deserti]|uniref:Competence protein ComGB n=1 Tax=Peribacillus deserti TaxID=673318 RepID=A0ABS2QJE3_9BACI|nr:competence type IV pilus assembly protein ComGB [Peribacillus deserti]MBM7693287.1 competence protein ComGB [Peribacillus deserti]
MKISKWPVKEQAGFLIELGELLELGYSLSHALTFVQLNKNSKKAKDLDYALKLLKEGSPFYSVLEALHFQRNMTSYVYFSEQHGMLSKSLKEAGGFWLKRSIEVEKMKKLVLYPLFLLLFVLLVFYGFENLLLPKFETLFASMNPSGNTYLKIISSFSHFLKKLPLITLLLIFLSGMYYLLWYRKLCPLKQMSLKLKIPVAGRFIRIFTTQFFASQLSGLLAGGLSINESFHLFSMSGQQPFYQRVCENIQHELTKGRSLESILSTLPYFENNLATITASGQKYGKLDQELSYYSKKLLSVLEERIESYLKVVQPALFAIVGLLIVSIYMAVLLPMYSLLNSL